MINVKNTLKKAISAFMAGVMAFGAVPFAFAGGETAKAPKKNYIIESPYEGIDWDAWDDYKTQLHCHTNASDGFLTIKEFCEMHYALDFEIVALTDHGTLNRGWNKVPETVPLMRLIKKERTNMAPIDPLTESEYQA